MFNHIYKRFNADNFRKHCTPNDFYPKTEWQKKQDGARWWQNATKEQASDEIWERGYNWKPMKERSNKTRSGESRGTAVTSDSLWHNVSCIVVCVYFVGMCT